MSLFNVEIEIDIFKKIMESMKLFFQEIDMQITKQGMLWECVDSANVLFTYTRLHCSLFSVFELDDKLNENKEQISIINTIRLCEICDMMKNIKLNNGYKICLNKRKNNNQDNNNNNNTDLYIILKKKGKPNIEIEYNPIYVEREKLSLHESSLTNFSNNYDIQCMIHMESFRNTIMTNNNNASFNTDDITIQFIYDKKVIIFITKTASGTKKVHYDTNQCDINEFQIDIQTKNNFEITLPLKYLNLIIKTPSAYNYIFMTIKGEGYPVLFTFILDEKNISYIHYYIAIKENNE